MILTTIHISLRGIFIMLRTYQATISRRQLKSGDYVPEKITALREEPIDYDFDIHYYDPAVAMLERMIKDTTSA